MSLSPQTLSRMCEIKPEDIIVNRGCRAIATRRRWLRIHTAQRLVCVHGFDRALKILNREDHSTETDISAWNAIGRRSAA